LRYADLSRWKIILCRVIKEASSSDLGAGESLDIPRSAECILVPSRISRFLVFLLCWFLCCLCGSFVVFCLHWVLFFFFFFGGFPKRARHKDSLLLLPSSNPFFFLTFLAIPYWLSLFLLTGAVPSFPDPLVRRSYSMSFTCACPPAPASVFIAGSPNWPFLLDFPRLLGCRSLTFFPPEPRGGNLSALGFAPRWPCLPSVEHSPSLPWFVFSLW